MVGSADQSVGGVILGWIPEHDATRTADIACCELGHPLIGIPGKHGFDGGYRGKVHRHFVGPERAARDSGRVAFGVYPRSDDSTPEYGIVRDRGIIAWSV